MNNDLKQGLAIGVVFSALVAIMPTKAEANDITDDELCDKAVAYSVKYLPEEDGLTLHEARWQIIKGDRSDDMQKLVGLVMFEIGQRIGYSYDAEVHGEGPQWIRQQVEKMSSACVNVVSEMRKESYNEIDSANPDEVW